MKKLCILLAILLLVTLVVSCKEKLVDPTNPITSPTKATDSATPTGATDTVDPTASDSTDGTEPDEGQKPPAVQSIEKEFYNMLNNSWYRTIMGCTFDKPKNINAWYLFYNGVTNYQLSKTNSFTEDDKFFVHNTFGGTKVIKLPVAEINNDLSKYFGITIADIQIPERWIYYDKSDAYFFENSGAFAVGDFSVTKVEQTEGGLTMVYWEINGMYLNTVTDQYYPLGNKTKMIMTMQLQSDGTYRVLSNLPQE